MKKLFCIWFSLIIYGVQGQHFDLNYQRYIGSEGKTYYFFQYGKRSGLVKPSLVKYELTSENEFKLKETKNWLDIRETGFFVYKNDIIELFYSRLRSEVKIKLNDTTLVYKVDVLHDFTNVSIEYLPEKNLFFIAAHEQASIYQFALETFEFGPLPLTGSNLYVRGDYLFFEALRYSDYYSSFPKDVYRVKLDDLKNPERVLIQVNKWYPYSDEVLYASTDPFLTISGEQTNGFYNLKDQTVAKSHGIDTQDIIEINGGTYILEIAEKNVEKVFQLEKLPHPPKFFPYKIIETGNQEPKGKIFQWYNIPSKEKTLQPTFVTQELLYKASDSELRNLSKDQLRILRNTFFAFQGYKFSSPDLAEFFNQFDWYRKMSMGKKSNDDIVIWPDEKLRVDLIRSIEDDK